MKIEFELKIKNIQNNINQKNCLPIYIDAIVQGLIHKQTNKLTNKHKSDENK